MQGSRIRLLAGGIILATISCVGQAETLQADPAWQQGKLENGFNWQLLTTPQRPSDRIELRLVVNSGSLVENGQQSGYSQLLPRLALVHGATPAAVQPQSLWQQGSIQPSGKTVPEVLTSYNYTMYNLSVPNSHPEQIKEALAWLATTAGSLTINARTVNAAQHANLRIATWPVNTQDAWWRYRLQRSNLPGHDPAQEATDPVDLAQLNAFYKQWYTPDAMTLFVVGNVDSRNLIEQINKTFTPLTGKRQQPAAVPTLSSLKGQPVNLINSQLTRDRLSLVWDTAWTPILSSEKLQRFWLSDLAREALFWHVQQVLSEKKIQGVQVGFDCRVLYQRAQCAINMDSDNEALNKYLTLIAKDMASVRDNGLSQQEFDALMAQKKLELTKLFATYARTETLVLMNQRLRSQQNGVVDIAPEQYQKLRQAFLSGLTRDILNQELRQQLSQHVTMALSQPPGEAETSVRPLQESWDKIMNPEPNVTAPAAAAATTADAQTTVTDPQLQ